MSWTYDSALAATALTFAFEKSEAEQLLDQLAALQRTDGSIDYAYDVSTGAGVPLFRSGTVAWVGLSAHDVPQPLRLLASTTRWSRARRSG